MKRSVSRADAEAIRADVDAKRGFPRIHPESEIVRIGGGIHVETIVTTTAVGILGDGAQVSVTLADDDERHVEPSRRARMRAAKDAVEDRRDPADPEPKAKH